MATMLIHGLDILALAVLVALSSFASYLRLLMRRLAPVAARKVFPPHAAGRVGADRERVGISISALHGALMAGFAAGLAIVVWDGNPQGAWVDLGTTVLIVLGVIAIFDQLIPFVLVARHDEPEKILAEWGGLLRATVFLAAPLTFPILVSTTIRRLLEADAPEAGPATPQEDLQELLEVGAQEGLIQREEGEMLQSVVAFGDTLVREIMTPRPEIAALEAEASIEDLRALYREKRHSRIPVYRDTLDQIDGLVSVGDLVELPPEAQERATLQSLLRPVPFVPETKRNADLLRELQRSTTQLAIVIDEYGSVAGLVTLEDLLEEIVGEIRDEVEPHERDIIQESAHTYGVAGHTELARLAEVLDLPIEAGEYSTVAGLVLAELGHVPRPGEKVETQGLTLEVLEATPRAVLRVRVRVPATRRTSEAPPPPAQSAAPGAGGVRRVSGV
ncbi:MAG TPA: hemolysin family protein [Terriglobia bacterium]|nr:hemolysin family protein [Terriglobia bacterium]